MPEFTAALLAKLVGGALILAVLSGFYWHYKHLESEAAKVPVLEQRVTDYAKADKDRASADKNLSDWFNNVLLPTIKGLPRAASAAQSSCLPRPDERGVRNDAIAKLLPKPTSAPQ